MDQHSYAVDDDPKMLRETLASAQVYLLNYMKGDRKFDHSKRLQRLIDECDRKRPLGSDGKHGKRHTDECGCEDR